MLCAAVAALVGCGAATPLPTDTPAATDVPGPLAATLAPLPPTTITTPAATPAPTPTAQPASSYCQFGATTAAWDSCHQVDPQHPNESGYGPFIPAPGGGEDQFAAVDHTGGRVVGFIEAFTDGTVLAIAQHTIETQLPPDAQQTAIYHAQSRDGTSACILINYESASLAQWIGGGPWGDTQGAIGVDLYQVNADGSGSRDTTKVNTASADIAPVTASTSC